MRISIILPNFNGSKYLARAVESFIEQRYEAKELIIVDAKSTDGSHDLIRGYAGEHPQVIKWVQESDVGISDAINIGIRHSSGDIIGFLGSDDVLLNGALEQVHQFCSRVDCDGVYFNKYLYFVQEREFILRRPPAPKITTTALLEHGTITDLQTMFYRRRVYEKYQLNPKNRTCMDYELLFELARDDAFLAHADTEVVLEYMDGNISHGDPRQLREAQEVAQKFMGDYDGPLWSDYITGRKTKREQAFLDRVAALENEIRHSNERADAIAAELDRASQNAAQAEQRAAQVEQRAAQVEQRAAQAEQRAAQAEQQILRMAEAAREAATERQRLQAELAQVTHRYEAARGEAQRLQEHVAALLASTSWKITKPVRALVGLVRRQR
ncbi:glycosyltransferase [Microvirga sp. 0TCS3.31]